MFSIDDAPVLPLHPHCHCSFCIPREGNDAEITASGQDLTSVYMDANVKGYERIPKGSARKITFSMSEIRSAPDAVMLSMAGGRPQAPAGSGAVQPLSNVPGNEMTEIGENEKPRSIINDISEELSGKAEKGSFHADNSATYSADTHRAEIKVADMLARTFGGDITLKTEANKDKVKTPDFEWDGKDWELKTCTSEKSADSAMRKAIKQISPNPGGIVLDYGDHDVNMGTLEDVVTRRFLRNDHIDEMTLIILNKDGYRVWKLKK